MSIKNILITLLFVSTNIIYGIGFVENTLVKTSTGYARIADLKVGNKVICYDFKDDCVERPVTYIHKQKHDSYFEVFIAGELIRCASGDKFFLPEGGKWIEAKNLMPGQVLLSHCTEFKPIDLVREIDEPVELYDITVEEFHNFCISTNDIHVHNWLPLVQLTMTWTPGIGVAITGAVGMLGAAVGGVFWSSSKEAEKEAIFRRMEIENAIPDAMKRPKRPCDKFNPQDTDCYYEDAFYHHFNSVGNNSGGKSKAPQDGLGALHNSVRIDKYGNSAERIGVSHGEFVVLDYTCHDSYGNCKFHGHVREWKELDDGMKRRLKEAGIITWNGKNNYKIIRGGKK